MHFFFFFSFYMLFAIYKNQILVQCNLHFFFFFFSIISLGFAHPSLPRLSQNLSKPPFAYFLSLTIHQYPVTWLHQYLLARANRLFKASWLKRRKSNNLVNQLTLWVKQPNCYSTTCINSVTSSCDRIFDPN